MINHVGNKKREQYECFQIVTIYHKWRDDPIKGNQVSNLDVPKFHTRHMIMQCFLTCSSRYSISWFVLNLKLFAFKSACNFSIQIGSYSSTFWWRSGSLVIKLWTTVAKSADEHAAKINTYTFRHLKILYSKMYKTFLNLNWIWTFLHFIGPSQDQVKDARCCVHLKQM